MSRRSSSLTVSVGVAAHEARRQDRQRPAQARRPGRRPARRPRRRFLAPLPISRLWGVGERDRRGPARVRRHDDRRPGRARPGPPRCAGSASMGAASPGGRGASTPTRSSDRRAGEVGRPRAHVRRGHSDPEVIERTLLAMAEGVAGRLRAGGVKAATVGVKIRDPLPDPHPAADPAGAHRSDRPDLRTALDLARPQIAGIRVRLVGVTASEPQRARAAVAVRSPKLRHRRRVVQAEDALRDDLATGPSPGPDSPGPDWRRRSSGIRGAVRPGRAEWSGRRSPQAGGRHEPATRFGRDKQPVTGTKDTRPGLCLTSNKCSVEVSGP